MSQIAVDDSIDSSPVSEAALAHGGSPGSAGSRLWRLRHRHWRVRDHGPAAECGRYFLGNDPAGRLCHQRLCARRRHRCAGDRRPCRQDGPALAASAADGHFRRRQHRERDGADLRELHRDALHHRPAAWRLFRRRRARRRLDGAGAQAGPRRRPGHARPHDRDPARHAARNLFRPVARLARRLHVGRRHRPRDGGADLVSTCRGSGG